MTPDPEGRPFWSRPEHHILVRPGDHPFPINESGRMEYIKTVWYATNRAQPTFMLEGTPIRLVVGKVVMTYRSWPIAQSIRPNIVGDHILLRFGRLRIVAKWPQGSTRGRPMKMATRGHFDIIGFVTRQNEIKPFITIAMTEVPFTHSWSHTVALHEGCKAGYWFQQSSTLYFTDERDAVFARLLLSI